ncbi:MAG: DUF1501 domain-containing protein [Sediminibacterium sp. Gen4]|jgi:uncharacterized protein (DUF1501 family)|uniref:DUF1501 domain-containing protein n=1 Tax=unclassified Sediminibacterium TaxID=2635961 RepID=UPI0015BD1E18|nr:MULTISPECIES: DUF1501 domain-containing protein [unclassified Sediminibacterium]MBW0160143.1 DUF1501 domain-containing protein [Sediminibacterium sp.]MBW0163606.1 DUF1501 domain-containing protein [Sediminibacterium sp.]NWK66469.1 DUF1501 domain-containing protein [Sediminibacterium sp. Gen4]
MRRRDFLRNTVPAGVMLPSLINGMTVKAFGAESLLMQGLFPATTDTDHVLVIVQLNGGNDGLNTVIPIEYFPNYIRARSNMYIPQQKVLGLSGNDRVGFHPAMTGMQALYNDGKMSVIHSVGYPQPNFSHFRATDIWMSASDSKEVVNSGWTGRYLNYEYPNFPNGYPNSSMPDPLAIQIGSTTSLALQGPAVSMGMSISNPSNFYNLIAGVQDPAPNTPAGKELTYIRKVAQQTTAYAEVIKTASAKVTQQAEYPNNSLAAQLKIVARLIAGGLKTRIYMVSYGGFDTHSAQVNSLDHTTGTHANLLKNVSDSIKAFQDDLKLQKVDDRVLGMTFSEFGRRIKSNGSTGTDHGSAAPMFVFGKNVDSGVIGDTPNIPVTASFNDNLPFQYDFRSVYATILNKWLCVDADDLEQIMLKNFQVLPIVNSLACNKSVNLSGENFITNYPNPFTQSTNISFKTAGGHTLIQIMDTMGRVLKNLIDREYEAGNYNVVFDGSGLQPGVYYIRFQNMVVQQVRAMLKVR